MKEYRFGVSYEHFNSWFSSREFLNIDFLVLFLLMIKTFTVIAYELVFDLALKKLEVTGNVMER